MDWLLDRLSSSKTQGISTSNLVAHRFDAIPENHIRLLVLESARFSHQVVCRLITVSILDLPEYVALSYTWGDPDRRVDIVCNGSKLSITKDLCMALRFIRHRENLTVLWIDQICIDQESIQERGIQVSYMRQIYSKASQVLIWLGDQHKSSLAGLALAQRIIRLEDEPNGVFDTQKQLERSGYKSRQFEWESLYSFLRRPWFSRIWTVQEVVLGKEIIVMCGSSRMTWEELEVLTWRIFEAPNPSNPDYGNSRRNRVQTIKSLRSRETLSLELDTSDLLVLFRPCGATDPRDRVYGLLGIGLDYQLPPQYDISTAQVYQNLAVDYIGAALNEKHKRERVIKLLVCAGYLNQSLSLPSWVPDWSINPLAVPTILSQFGKDCNEETSHENEIDIIRGKHVNDGTILRVTGQIWDHVKDVGAVSANFLKHQTSAKREALFISWLEEAKELMISLQKQPGYPQYPTEESYQEGFRWLLESAVEVDSQPVDYQIKELGVDPTCFDRIPDPQTAAWFDLPGPSFYKYAMILCQDRVFVTTKRGYIGLAPKGTEVGDELTIFLEIKTYPMLIRPNSHEHKLLGYCPVYVGQAFFSDSDHMFRILREDDVEVQQITLR